jgi:hypothetical protein
LSRRGEGSNAQEFREVIVARFWGGLTFDQIARLQGCSLTTAHRRYRDGLSRLLGPCLLALPLPRPAQTADPQKPATRPPGSPSSMLAREPPQSSRHRLRL